MNAIFLACAVFGALVLMVQIGLALFGIDSTSDAGDFHIGGAGLGEGLELLSVRSLAAGTAFFGLTGLVTASTGAGWPIAFGAGLVVGGATLVGTALLTRQMLRLESDGSLQIERAIGTEGRVYLTIPGGMTSPGKVQVSIQGRTAELAAVTRSPKAIPTGSQVVVVSIVDSDTVEVLPTSLVQEVLDGKL